VTDQSSGLGGEPPETTPAQDPIEQIVHDAEMPEDLMVEDEPSTAPSEVDLLRMERDEYLDHLRRLQAEFDNFRKRMLREQTVLVERANESLIEQLLPVLDAFEMAVASGGGSDPERLRKGVELVYGELTGVLSKSGLERIEATGKPFDPEEHEAVMHVDAEDGETGVLDVVRAGYRLKGRVLRPAMVKVAT
jgi:molecular chaperone GrpE